MPNTVKSETGEMSEPLPLPEKPKSAEIGDGTHKRNRPGDVNSFTPTFGSEIGDGSISPQPAEEHILAEIGEGHPKSGPLSGNQQHGVEDADSYIAPAPGSETGEGCPKLPPPGTQKLPEYSGLYTVIPPAFGSEIGEGCPKLQPAGIQKLPENDEGVVHPSASEHDNLGGGQADLSRLYEIMQEVQKRPYFEVTSELREELMEEMMKLPCCSKRLENTDMHEYRDEYFEKYDDTIFCIPPP